MHLNRPVVVTGTPRSGKSCLALILNHLDEFKQVSEPMMIWNAGMGSRPDDTRGADEVTQAVREDIVRGCQALIADQPQARYIDDLSHHALRVPFLHGVMPQIKIIHMIRPAREAIPEILYGWTYRDSLTRVVRRRRHAIKLSALPRLALRFFGNQLTQRLTGKRLAWGPRVPGMKEFAAGHPVHEIAAFQWMKMVEIAMDDLKELPADSRLEVRFERLLADPQAEVRRVGEFCQVQDVDLLVQHAKAYIDPERKYHRRIELTDEQWQDVERLIAPLQRRLDGYDPSAAS